MNTDGGAEDGLSSSLISVTFFPPPFFEYHQHARHQTSHASIQHAHTHTKDTQALSPPPLYIFLSFVYFVYIRFTACFITITHKTFKHIIEEYCSITNVVWSSTVRE